MTRDSSGKSDAIELIVSALAVTVSLVVVATCGAVPGPSSHNTHPIDALPGAPAMSGTPSPTTSIESTSTPRPSGWSSFQNGAVSKEGNVLPALSHLFGGLVALAEGKRREHVRVLWLGDSHTQADFWTDALRRKLQHDFGIGGPGFIHVGWNTRGYRLSGTTLHASGFWKIEPISLVSPTQVDDGVFGLGGVRLSPLGRDSTARIDVASSALGGPASWDLAFRFMRAPSGFSMSSNGRKIDVSTDSHRFGVSTM